MPGYRVEFLSRDHAGRFERFSRVILADDHDEAYSWTMHRYRNGRAHVESDVTTTEVQTGDTATHPAP